MLRRMVGIHLKDLDISVGDHLVRLVAMAFKDQRLADVELGLHGFDHRLDLGAGRLLHRRDDLPLDVEEEVPLAYEPEREFVGVAGDLADRLSWIVQRAVVVKQDVLDEFAALVDALLEAEGAKNALLQGPDGLVPLGVVIFQLVVRDGVGNPDRQLRSVAHVASLILRAVRAVRPRYARARHLSSFLFPIRKQLIGPNTCGKFSPAGCGHHEKVFPIAKRIGGRHLKVIFRDGASHRLFCSEAMLDRRFGRARAERIKLRLLLLRAATNLAMVPTRPPFSLRRIARNRFELDIDPPLVLRIEVDGAEETELNLVKTVMVLGVE